MGAEKIHSQELLTPDRRWKVWGCQSHEQFLEKYFLPGKFYSTVPEKIKEAYLIVERLIAYSYFYYPLTEEAESKLSRIFEMALRIRAQELGIPTDKKIKTGKLIPENLSVLIEKLKKHSEIDQEWAEEWIEFKSLRNLFAHPLGPNYCGPINLLAIVPMINVINSIFISADWFKATRDRVNALQDRTKFYSEGVYVLTLSGCRYIIKRARPILVSHDEKRSLWMMEPIGLKFPQTMDEYFLFNPFILRISELTNDEESLHGIDYQHNQKFIITHSNHPSDLKCTKDYFEQMNTAEEQVRTVYYQNFYYHLNSERARFIYDEFWI